MLLGRFCVRSFRRRRLARRIQARGFGAGLTLGSRRLGVVLVQAIKDRAHGRIIIGGHCFNWREDNIVVCGVGVRFCLFWLLQSKPKSLTPSGEMMMGETAKLRISSLQRHNAVAVVHMYSRSIVKCRKQKKLSKPIKSGEAGVLNVYPLRGS